jgi:hypothetical protein
MRWGAQNRSKDAKTPSGSRGRSDKPEPGLWPVQQYAPPELQTSNQPGLLGRLIAPACIIWDMGAVSPSSHRVGQLFSEGP